MSKSSHYNHQLTHYNAVNRSLIFQLTQLSTTTCRNSCQPTIKMMMLPLILLMIKLMDK